MSAPIMPPFPPMDTSFHPDFMFCGACTECGPVDPPTNTKEPPEQQERLLPESTLAVDVDENDDPTVHSVLHVQQPESKSPRNALLIESLLQPLPGVTRVNVVTSPSSDTLVVAVDHNTLTHELIRTLSQAGFPSTVMEEAGKTTPNCEETGPLIRTSLAVTGLCCATEVPVIRRIVKPIVGVSSLQINIALRRVYVMHSCSATDVADALGKGGFPSRILNSSKSSSVSILSILTGSFEAEQVDRIKNVLRFTIGVEHVDINDIDGEIRVRHNASVSAADLQTILEPTLTVQVQSTSAGDDVSCLARSKFVESTLQVHNYTRKHADLLQTLIRQNYIVESVRGIRATGSCIIKVQHNPSAVKAQDVCVVLQGKGLQASVVHEGRDFLPASCGNDGSKESNLSFEEWNSTEQWKGFAILSGVFWVVSLVGAVGDWDHLKYAGLLSVAFGLPPVALKAWRTVCRGALDANVMMLIAAVGAAFLGEFDEAASVSFLFAVSEYLEVRATSRARYAMSELCDMQPDYAHWIHPDSKEIVVVPAKDVPKGSSIAVRTGDKIAADGIVTEGTSLVDESSLTGESTPVRKTVGDVVSGGSINVGTTQLVAQTSTSVEDSTVSRLVRLIEDAQANRSPTEKMIDGFARAYTPVVLLLALCMATIPWIIGDPTTGRQWTMNALIIIVIACPCALTISTPVTYAAGLAASAQRGVIIKGGATLEALGRVETVVFDKTGTLTEGRFIVAHLELIGTTRTRKEMLQLLALMEAPSSHPLAETLVHAAKKEGVSKPKDVVVLEHTILKGEGVTASVNGKKMFVGNKRLFNRLGMYGNLSVEQRQRADLWSFEGGTVGFLGIEGEGIVGSFCMKDQVRKESRSAVRALHQDGVEVIMLTGDGPGAADTVGALVGIRKENVRSQLLPEDKLHFVGSIIRPPPKGFGLVRTQPTVLFCGDGVNDGPALAVADIGVSMGEGAALAMEMSDVTLMDSNIRKIPYIVQTGKRVTRTIQENISMSLGCKILVVSLTFLGKMSLLYAIASDVGVMLIVTLNGMKLLPGVSQEDRVDKSDERQPLNSPDGFPETEIAEMV